MRGSPAQVFASGGCRRLAGRGRRHATAPPSTARQRSSPLLGSLLCPDEGGGCTVAATDTASFTENAMAFFDAVETGKGWEACSAYCDRDATFEAQADALANVLTLRDYAEWMKGMLAVLPDARYELKSFAVDTERQNVAAYAVFHGTHTGEAGPVP